MSALVIGVGIGVALSWTVRHIDAALAEYDHDGPLARLYARIVQWPARHVYRRYVTRARDAALAWWLQLSPVSAVLGQRRWRVTYISVCMYGSDREQGGVPPRPIATSWHWTERGAEWHRRHRPNYVGWGSFYSATVIEHAPTGPYDLAEMAS